MVCTKPGFAEARATVPSGFQEWTLGNIILGGVVGLAIDWSDGAIHDYPAVIQVPMSPASGGGGGGGTSNVTSPDGGAGS